MTSAQPGLLVTFFYFGKHLETDAHRRTQSHDLNPAHTLTPEKKRTQHTGAQKALSTTPSMDDMSSFDTPVVGSTNPQVHGSSNHPRLADAQNPFANSFTASAQDYEYKPLSIM
jgi:hypothetical protein